MSRNVVGHLDLALLLPSPGTNDSRLLLSYLGLIFPAVKWVIGQEALERPLQP